MDTFEKALYILLLGALLMLDWMKIGVHTNYKDNECELDLNVPVNMHNNMLYILKKRKNYKNTNLIGFQWTFPITFLVFFMSTNN